MKIYRFLQDIIKEKLFIKYFFYGFPLLLFSQKGEIIALGDSFLFAAAPQRQYKDAFRYPQKCQIIKFNILSYKFLPAFKSKRSSVGITLYITSLSKHFLYFLGDRKI